MPSYEKLTTSVQEKIKGKNPKRVLPQWKREVKLQKARMNSYLIASLVTVTVAIGGFFCFFIPRWLQVVCFLFLPFEIFGFFADRHIYLTRKAEVEELEKLIGQNSNQDVKAIDEPAP